MLIKPGIDVTFTIITRVRVGGGCELRSLRIKKVMESIDNTKVNLWLDAH